MRASLPLLQLLYIVDVFAGRDLRSFWADEGLALSEVSWNSVTDRYVEKSDFSGLSNQYSDNMKEPFLNANVISTL